VERICMTAGADRMSNQLTIFHIVSHVTILLFVNTPSLSRNEAVTDGLLIHRGGLHKRRRGQLRDLRSSIKEFRDVMGRVGAGKRNGGRREAVGGHRALRKRGGTDTKRLGHRLRNNDRRDNGLLDHDVVLFLNRDNGVTVKGNHILLLLLDLEVSLVTTGESDKEVCDRELATDVSTGNDDRHLAFETKEGVGCSM
jgi:hypothetical protein